MVAKEDAVFPDSGAYGGWPTSSVELCLEKGREPKKPTSTVVNREKYFYGRYDVGDAEYYPGNAGPKPETPRDAIYEVGPGTGRSAGAGADLVNGVPWRLWLWPCVPGVISGVPDVVATVKVLFPIHDGVGWLFGLSTPGPIPSESGVPW